MISSVVPAEPAEEMIVPWIDIVRSAPVGSLTSALGRAMDFRNSGGNNRMVPQFGACRRNMMQHADKIALRRVKMLVEQYVLTRSRRYDFVSTELACRAIREVMRSPIEDAELDRMLARSAARQGLSVRFDRMEAWQAASPSPTEGVSI
ncbi:hypothetical protein LB530_17815 [Mesorhizobium sp. CO1-1-3]|uniref:hypothetical protein n=1 Tax=Mesorhizobium sp. CO1-1-3 TaxID=2876634 RepID=UPI001CCC8D4E|nr:hypothetical protein [Mesorhizobium sp. CO1-1-3]MBZ9702739.1 hypothetical protein [Mesorhizobium sp. CO1-1-3]MBZ9948542.1 hypothetical protein [Mesorhizobium sp. BR1-1-11]